jgi:6-pyruvoyltetrahydropterin/6-carboxytetrahydropterin synthase
MTNRLSLTRKESFSASHRLHSPSLGAEENLRIFGKCNNLNGHGHNYLLEVTVTAELDAVTGMLMNLDTLKQIIKTHVINKLDHKNLNLDVPEFMELNPTAENIVVVIWSWLEEALGGERLHEVLLHETDKNSAKMTRL